MFQTILSGMRYSAITLPLILAVAGLCVCSSGSDGNGWSPTADHVFLNKDSLGQRVVYQTPESFIFDNESGCYFVSNVNGDPLSRWDNGYIIKFDRKMALVDNYFINGRDRDKILHAPKGMTVRDGILYVADIDAVRGFSVRTGEQLVNLSLRAHGALYLNDITADTSGNLYISDLMANVVFMIDRASRVTVLAELSSPSGLCFHRNGFLYAVTREKPALYGIALDGSVEPVKTDASFGRLAGLDVDSSGDLYFSDSLQGKIYRYAVDSARMTVVADNLEEPANISLDRRHDLILIPHLLGTASVFRTCEFH
ncbi:MAG: hypothetical protein JSV44_03185 [Candidatus Zixiibacteriota bacterium]|nr:MAG: hypothetical protein JSV44_03185 [candidate division Zixibacteria bacterium]